MHKERIVTQIMKHIKKANLSHIQSKISDMVSEDLLSPFILPVDQRIVDEIQTFIRTIFEMRCKSEYLSALESTARELNIFDPGNNSILMSYDFHIDEQGTPKLIEVNTNSAFLAMGLEMYETHGLPPPINGFSINTIRENILNEVNQFESNNLKIGSDKPLITAIVDQDPEAQRLFIEFILYQSHFINWGWESQILDVGSSELNVKNYSFIYNRCTDFYFNTAMSHKMRQLYEHKKICISPQPFEYHLLADKNRLINWQDENFLSACRMSQPDQQLIKKIVPFCYNLDSSNYENLWLQKKKIFIKPKNSFGSKQAFRGQSISRKLFNDCALTGQFLAQEFVPAKEKVFDTPSGPQSFKYDLRCYAYRGDLQLILARLYQGQVTNLKTQYGGFAPIRVV